MFGPVRLNFISEQRRDMYKLFVDSKKNAICPIPKAFIHTKRIYVIPLIQYPDNLKFVHYAGDYKIFGGKKG